MGNNEGKPIHKFVWIEDASQGTFSKIALRAGPNLNGWKNKLTDESTPTAWVHAMMEIIASNDFHETLISKWTSWKNARSILISMCDWDNYYSNHHVQRRLLWGWLWLWWWYWSIFWCSCIWIRYWILHRKFHIYSGWVSRRRGSCWVIHHIICPYSCWNWRTFDNREVTKINSDRD